MLALARGPVLGLLAAYAVDRVGAPLFAVLAGVVTAGAGPTTTQVALYTLGTLGFFASGAAAGYVGSWQARGVDTTAEARRLGLVGGGAFALLVLLLPATGSGVDLVAGARDGLVVMAGAWLGARAGARRLERRVAA